MVKPCKPIWRCSNRLHFRILRTSLERLLPVQSANSPGSVPHRPLHGVAVARTLGAPAAPDDGHGAVPWWPIIFNFGASVEKPGGLRSALRWLLHTTYGWGGGGVGTRPRWLALLASRHCSFGPSVGPNVFWLCQRSPRMTCPV